MVLAFVLELTVQEKSFSSWPNFIENILFTLLVFFIINQFSCFKKIISLIIISHYLFLFIETGLYLLFQTRINAAYIHVILNTNFNEAMEFSTVYYKNNLFWLLLFFIPLLGVFNKRIFKRKKFNIKNIPYTFSIVIIVVCLLKFSNLVKWNIPYVSIKSYFQYKKQLNAINKFKSEVNFYEINKTTNNNTIVVIIGESTSRKHMGVYGYTRNTSPKLNSFKDSLAIYNNVISSKVYTTASIFDALTLSNYENIKITNSLLGYIKKAGYKIFWLSNQRPVGLNDNLVSKIASEADESVFLSYNDFRHSTLYDEVLLPKLNVKLEDNSKKVIFRLINIYFPFCNFSSKSGALIGKKVLKKVENFS